MLSHLPVLKKKKNYMENHAISKINKNYNKNILLHESVQGKLKWYKFTKCVTTF